MFRKIIIAATAAVAMGTAALAPTSASAFGWHHHHHHFRHFGFFAPALIAGAAFAAEENCYQRRLVETRHGLRRIWVNVCE